jgi:dihydroxy-acid dehydratase
MTRSFDKSTLPSRHVSVGPERAPHRSYYYAMGLSEEEIARPFVALASAGNNSAPCNTTLDAQADAAQIGVNNAGGMPRRFNTITVTDGIAMGHQGMKSSLVSREVIADSVELSVRGHCYDALVGFAGCDKSLPGMMMAMLRLNVPSIFVYGGSILPGRYHEKDVTVVDVFEAVGQFAAGNCPIADLHELEKVACPGHGACGGQFTANTMACVGEAIGLSLPNSNMVPAPYSTREQIAVAAGAQVMELIHLNLRPRDICTREAFINAARVVAATGGSTNAALHLPAMAHEAGIDFDLFDVAEAFKSTPYIADLKPGGQYVAKDMYEAGGVYMLMKTMLAGGFLDGNCMTVTGKTLGENIDQVTWNPDQKVIYDINTPITPTGGVVGWCSKARRACSIARRIRSPRSRRARSPTAKSLSSATRAPRAARACAKCFPPPPRSMASALVKRSRWSPTAASPAARAASASAMSAPKPPMAVRSPWSRMAI